MSFQYARPQYTYLVAGQYIYKYVGGYIERSYSKSASKILCLDFLQIGIKLKLVCWI